MKNHVESFTPLTCLRQPRISHIQSFIDHHKHIKFQVDGVPLKQINFK